jgi:hypothetical protein
MPRSAKFPHRLITEAGNGDHRWGGCCGSCNLCLAAGASGLITDCHVEKGNPADSTLTVEMIKRHIEIYDWNRCRPSRIPSLGALETALALRRSGADPKALRRALRRIEELLDE